MGMLLAAEEYYFGGKGSRKEKTDYQKQLMEEALAKRRAELAIERACAASVLPTRRRRPSKNILTDWSVLASATGRALKAKSRNWLCQVIRETEGRRPTLAELLRIDSPLSPKKLREQLRE